MRVMANIALGATLLLLAAGGCVRRTTEKRDLVLATVRQKDIKESDFQAHFERLDSSLRGKYRRDPEALLDKMVEEEVIYQHALEQNLDQTPEAKKRAARAEQDAAIKHLKQLEIYSRVAVTQEEIEERYHREVKGSEASPLVKSVLYICNLPDDGIRDMLDVIDRGVEQGLSFPEIARQNSLPYQSFDFDSPEFIDSFPPQIQSAAARMKNRTGVMAMGLGRTAFYLFKDAEPLSSCFRRIGRTIRREKGERAIRQWLSSRRDSSTIRLHEKLLDDMTQPDAVAAEVNGVPLTVRDVTTLLEGLSEEERNRKLADKKALLDEAIDRELLRQEAVEKKLFDDKEVKEEVARKTRRILIELATESRLRGITGITPAAREESFARWVEQLKKTAAVKIFAENLKKVYIPASKEIEDIFGTESI